MKTIIELYSLNTPVEASEILNIADMMLGANFVTLQDVEKFITDEDKNIWVARAGNKIVAFGTSVITSAEGEDSLKDYLNGSENFLYNVSPYLNEAKIVLVKTVAVAPTHNCKGIGVGLLKQVEQWGKENSCEYLLGLGWERNGVSVAEKMFNKIGGQRLTVIPNFWFEDSLKHAYMCAECGNPCRCSAVVLTKPLNS